MQVRTTRHLAFRAVASPGGEVELEIVEGNYRDQQAEGLITLAKLREKLDAVREEREGLEARLAMLADGERRLRELEELPALVEEYLGDLPDLIEGTTIHVQRYETVPPERTPENPLGIYTLTPERIRKRAPEELEKIRQERERERGQGTGSFMLCSGCGRRSTRTAPWRLRWGPPAELRRELCCATDQAHHPSPLRRHDEPLRRPRERHLHNEAL